jgi:EKC/KEOPS complex subunit PCC1/LAGE3
VDDELSPLVKREFSLASQNAAHDSSHSISDLNSSDDEKTTLLVHYKATTPRMLRVAVNGFFESLGVIVQVMEELDVDVLHEQGLDGLEGVQGLEQGMTGSGVGAGM